MRCAGAALVCAWGLASSTRADDPGAATNAPPATAPRPFLAPNPAATPFLQEHPELAEPSTPSGSGLTLRPDTANTNAPPEVIPPGAGIFPDTIHESNSMSDTEDNLAAHLLVVYNANDPDSKGLADYYATRRSIPAERMFSPSRAQRRRKSPARNTTTPSARRSFPT